MDHGAQALDLTRRRSSGGTKHDKIWRMLFKLHAKPTLNKLNDMLAEGLPCTHLVAALRRQLKKKIRKVDRYSRYLRAQKIVENITAHRPALAWSLLRSTPFPTRWPHSVGAWMDGLKGRFGGSRGPQWTPPDDTQHERGHPVMQPFTQPDILLALGKVTSVQAPGWDGVPPVYYKMARYSGSPPVTNLLLPLPPLAPSPGSNGIQVCRTSSKQ